MPTCNICGVPSSQLRKCRVCGDRFCDVCGSVEDKLCLYCMDDEEYEKDYEEDIYFEPSSKAQRSMYRIE